jgi:hypothetical protein
MSLLSWDYNKERIFSLSFKEESFTVFLSAPVIKELSAGDVVEYTSNRVFFMKSGEWGYEVLLKNSTSKCFVGMTDIRSKFLSLVNNGV